MSQALYRKWRPARFEDVIGQEHITHTLKNALIAGRTGHAYLFCGPRGTGKTTTARLLAKAVNCNDEDVDQHPCDACHMCQAVREGRLLDLIEIDAASNTGVDDIRDLRDKINFSPAEGRFKVYIIDEVHMLSTAAFNALLKTLEEPPAHAIFILATTEEHKVPATIKSRCRQFNFRLLSLQEIIGRLEWMVAKEGLQVEPQALALIAREGAGSLRDAESLLDQLVTGPDDVITLARTQQVLGTASSSLISALIDAWLSGAAASTAVGLNTIHEALASGADPRQLCRQIIIYMRQLLLLNTAGNGVALDIPAEQVETMTAQAGRADKRRLIRAIRLFSEAAVTSGSGQLPQLPLELAFIESLPDDAATNVAQSTAYQAPTPQPRLTPVAATAPPKAKREPPVAAAPTQSVAKKPQPSVQKEPPPTQTEPVPPPAAVKAASTAPFHFGSLQKIWPQLLALVRKSDRNVQALLSAGKPLNVEGNTIILGYDYPILKEKFDDNPNAATLVMDGVAQLLGTEATLRCVVTGQYTPPRQAVSREDVEALAQELGGVVTTENR